MGKDTIQFWCIAFIHRCILCERIRLDIETLEKPLYMSSPLGTRVSVDMIYRGYELEIFGILLTMDLRVMNISEFDVILGMDWLMAYRVIINCERKRVTTYTSDGTRVTF